MSNQNMTETELKTLNLLVRHGGQSWTWAYKNVLGYTLEAKEEDLVLVSLESLKLNQCPLYGHDWLHYKIQTDSTPKQYIVVGSSPYFGAYQDFSGNFVYRKLKSHLSLVDRDFLYPRLVSALYDSVPQRLRPYEFPNRQRFANSYKKRDFVKGKYENMFWAMVVDANKTHDWKWVADYLVEHHNEDFVLKNLGLQEFLYGFVKDDQLHIGVGCTYPMRVLKCPQ